MRNGVSGQASAGMVDISGIIRSWVGKVIQGDRSENAGYPSYPFVRYMGLAEGVTADAPICGASPCKPGGALGKTQPPSASIRVTLTAGTSLRVSALSDISTRTARKGDEFDAVLSENITVSGHVVARRGAIVRGVITNADSGGVRNPATLSLQIIELTIADGQTVSVITDEHKEEGYISNDAAAAGVVAALKASSAATRGGRGVGRSNISRLAAAQSTPAVVERETPVTFRLTSALTVTIKN